MKIFCITLQNAIKRQEKTTHMLSKLELDFEFFIGVDARVDTHPLLKHYDEIAFLNNMGRPAAAGEMGCYASHYLLWQKCVELNQPIIVLEDDLCIEPALLTQTLQHTHHYIGECGYIRIENARKNRLTYKVKSFDDQHLVKYLRVPQCTAGYAITPQAAARFLAASHEFTLPVDVFLRHTYLHGQPMFGITNPGLSGGSEPSVIGSRKRKGKKNYYAATMKIINKSKSMLLNLLMNINHLLTVPKKLRPSLFR